jgi:diguanylate cyclase (GGDEF)-like protein/PAS domain S-box-containing protein
LGGSGETTAKRQRLCRPSDTVGGYLTMVPRLYRPIGSFALFGVLLVAAIVIGIAMATQTFRDRALANNERELKNTALVLAEQTDRAFQSLDLVATSVIDRMQSLGIASTEDFERRMSGQDVQSLLKDKISGLPHIDAISIFDANGKMINLSRFWPVPNLNIADRKYFLAFQSNPGLNSLISEPVINRATGTWTVFLVRRLVGPSGKFLGVINGAMELAFFEKLFGAVVLNEHSSIALLRSDGMMLARYPRLETIIGTVFAGANNALGARDSGTYRLTGIVDGRDRLLATYRLPHFPLMITVATDVEAALADWRGERNFLIGAGALAVLAITLVFLLIVLQLSRGHRWSKQRLALEKQRLDTAVNNMSQGLLLFDASERIVVCNQRYIQMYGLSPDVVKPGCAFRDLILYRKQTGTFTGDIEEYHSSLKRDLARGKSTEKIIETPSGRSVRIINQPLANGGWVVTHEDITEARNAEQERDRNRKFLDLIIDNVPATIVVKDARSRQFVLINQTGEAYLGASRDQMIGKTARELRPRHIADMIDAHDQQLLDSDGYLLFDEHAVDEPGKAPRFVTSKKIIIPDDKGEPQYLLSVIEDVTERKRSEERIAHLAHYDALTDLPNRVLFREKLEQALRRVKRGDRLAVLYLDLDQFKTINDTLGHPVGDELLKVVAARLRACLRDTDVVGRLSGDEFAIIQSAIVAPSDAVDLATRIHATLREPCEAGSHQLVADASIGIALAPDDGTDPDQLLKHADLAMYAAKGGGRGLYCFFEPAMDARMKARRQLEFDLREAIMCGGFELHYQPLVGLQDGTIVGCECLLRWRHRERGMISPAEFIPLAEETGLIVPLGEWVLRTACAEVALWPEHVKVAVNVSPVQFKTANFVQMVISALAGSRLPARRLELEITEAVLIGDDEAVLSVLHQLRDLGVRIALDDFGTGYSSLSYLQRFPFDKVKIDRSFVKDIEKPDGSLAIVQAVVSIAKSRNMTTTAEGVETENQMELLRALGCTEMQGFFFSHALPEADFLRLMLAHRERAQGAA